LLIGQAECPVNNAPPMTMVINIPQRMLIVKVSKIADERGVTIGCPRVFHDITEVVSQAPDWKTPRDNAAAGKRMLRKIPTPRQQRRILLVDVPEGSFFRSEGHYTWVHTSQGSPFCNLNIGDLESRLDAGQFLRVHRVGRVRSRSRFRSRAPACGRCSTSSASPTPRPSRPEPGRAGAAVHAARMQFVRCRRRLIHAPARGWIALSRPRPGSAVPSMRRDCPKEQRTRKRRQR
jgi:hypothetical protein